MSASDLRGSALATADAEREAEAREHAAREEEARSRAAQEAAREAEAAEEDAGRTAADELPIFAWVDTGEPTGVPPGMLVRPAEAVVDTARSAAPPTA